MFLTVLSIAFPVFAITLLGYGYGRLKRPDLTVPNQLNMDVFVPALIFHALSDSHVQLAAYVPLALAGAGIILGSGLLVWPLCRWLRVDCRTFVPPMMFNNSGNLMIPLALLAFGPAALPPVIVLFLVEMLGNFTVGLYILDRNTRFTGLLKMPMILAMLLGLAASLLQIHLPEPVNVTIRMVGEISIPLMLFALGARMDLSSLKDLRLGIWSAILSPLSGVIMLLLMAPFLHLPKMQFAILTVFAALPPAVLNWIVAEQYRQEPDKVASIVMIGNLGSLVFIPLAVGYALGH